MIGLALAMVAAGLVLLFIVPWVGIPVGAVGLVLVALYFIAFARRRPAPERS